MNLFGVLNINGSALLAQRQRAEVVASNLANAETTRTVDGGPYRRRQVAFGARRPGEFGQRFASLVDFHARGVRVERVIEDLSPAIQHFDPTHPDADTQGYVAYPAIEPIEEMVNLMGAVRAYQLNLAAVQATKAMIRDSLEILR